MTHTALPPFHLAVPVDDLEAARRFYVELLGCGVGRSSDHWIDFDFFGHQVVAHRKPGGSSDAARNDVDGDRVPVPHFGAVLAWEDWEALGERLQTSGVSFVVPPRVRFRGQVGEQGTFFVRDPAGNALEFKSFRDPSRLFASD